MGDLVTRPTDWATARDDALQPDLLHYGDAINRYALDKVDRRYGLILFGRVLAFESSVVRRRIETLRLVPTDAPALTSAVRDRGRTLLPSAVAGALALAAIAAVLTQPGEPRSASASIVVPLPPPERVLVARRSGQVEHQRPRASVLAPREARSTPVTAEVAKIGSVAVNAGAPATLAQARAAALVSGEPTAWREGSRGGMVVVSPQRRQGDALCRTIAVFTRVDGDAGSAESGQACRPGVGAETKASSTPR